MPAGHLMAHTNIRTRMAYSSIDARNKPHGYLLAHRMVSAIICNNGWLIVPSVPDYRLMDICWLIGWYLISS